MQKEMFGMGSMDRGGSRIGKSMQTSPSSTQTRVVF